MMTAHGYCRLALWLLVTCIHWWCPVSAAWSWSFGDSTEEEKDESVIVSPIVNRQLETSVKAHKWPTTPQNVFCEALVFHNTADQPQNAFVYLDSLGNVVQQFYDNTNDDETGQMDKIFTWESARDVALQASNTDESERGLLKVALALRSGSPLCETHRGLARQALQTSGKLMEFQQSQVLAIVYPGGRVLLPGDMEKFDWTSVGSSSPSDTNEDSSSKWDDELLPGESPRAYGKNSTQSDQMVVLFGNLGTLDFVRYYEHLVSLQVPFVVRHLGAVGFEEDPSVAIPTTLQGYGVRLDIRNVEYKVFDDRRDRKMEGDGAINLTASPETDPGDFLAGVDLGKLGLNYDSADDIKIKLDLWRAHEEQQLHSQKVPPAWQRRQLPLQAATAIIQSENPLAALSAISQNLPSLASALVNVKIPDNITAGAEVFENELALKSGRIYINGRPMALDSPSFNVFEILNRIREEERAIKRIDAIFGPLFGKGGRNLVRNAWIQGAAFGEQVDDGKDDSPGGPSDQNIRVDVGRGWRDAVIYLNDIEKDSQYSKWPRSVRNMIQSMQFGMPPVVRRNVFTILAVIDPMKNPMLSIFQLGMQLVQNSYPARIGVLWVSQEDVDECRQWIQDQPNLEDGVPCPVKDILPKKKDLGSTKATAQAAHRLLTRVIEQYDMPQITLAFAEYLLATLEETLGSGDELTLDILVNIFAEMMEAMGVSDAATSREVAIDALMDPVPEYGNALRFAVEKNLHPDMGFLNGRPVDGTDPGAISRAFGQEQQHIFQLIMNEEITDTTPKSIYAKVLSGDNVYKKVHPLLLGSGSESSGKVFLEHKFGPASLIFPNLDKESTALFVAESVLNYSTKEGAEKLRLLLNSIGKFPQTADSSDGQARISIGYRILPATKADAESPLCLVLANAYGIEIDTLQKVLSEFEASGYALSSDQLNELLPEVMKRVNRRVCDSPAYMDKDWESKEMFVLNGHSYIPEDGVISVGDLELLLKMEFPRARAIKDSFDDLFSSTTSSGMIDNLGKVASFLGVERVNSPQRTDVLKPILDHERQSGTSTNQLWFHVLAADANLLNKLTSSIVVVIDPVSEAAQRVSSLLEVFVHHMGLSVDVVMTPPTLIDGDSKIPITSYYRFVADVKGDDVAPVARFANLPTNHILTIRMDVPEPWDVQQTKAVQDTDNLRCDTVAGCSDSSYESEDHKPSVGMQQTSVEYGLSSLLIFGQCYETSGSPPNGLQLVLQTHSNRNLAAEEFEIKPDGSTGAVRSSTNSIPERYSDTLVMKTVGYWQLRADAGVWDVRIAEDSKGASMFDFIEGSVKSGRVKVQQGNLSDHKKIIIKDFVNRGEVLVVQRRPGLEGESLFDKGPIKTESTANETINVFSLATGHLYERFLKIMMLSVTKRTSSKVKFWLFENFLSPSFKATAKAMADRIGCEVEFVTYKWPEWLRGQSEKQRIIWGYKILFLDVLFPLDVKKIIYVDADQVVRGDLKELWDMDLKGAPYGYTPFCTSRESTLGYQFWREGFWKEHLRGKPYHISALYVVDLERFRRTLVGDQLRAVYQQLSADPHSLANLDQDLPNYAQHMVPIFSLPQDWLWCESWCSDESKATAKTIDLCNNPMHKEPKKSMAIRVISGPLFNESWVELDAEVEKYEKEYFESLR